MPTSAGPAATAHDVLAFSQVLAIRALYGTAELHCLGGAACWPLIAGAQQKTIPVIGWLHFGSPAEFAFRVDALRQALAMNGYVDGKNVVVETRWAEGHLERLAALAAISSPPKSM
jgi:hypothetical protein